MTSWRGPDRRAPSQPNAHLTRLDIVDSRDSKEIVGTMPSQHLRIGFETDLTIRHAAAIKAALVERLEESRSLSIEINPDAVADLSFLQLVSAARLFAQMSGGELTLAEPASPTLRNVLLRAGFMDGASAEDLRFWLHSENAQ